MGSDLVKFCTGCGSSLSLTDMKFCTNCGAPRANPPKPVSKRVQDALAQIRADEIVIEWTEGLCQCRRFGEDAKRNGVVLATDRRVLIYLTKAFGGYELEEFPYVTMSSFEMGKGILGFTAKFIASGNSTRITMMNTGNPQGFINYVRSRIGTKEAARPADDLVSKLSKISDLHSKGLLSAEEFQQAKAKLLGAGC